MSGVQRRKKGGGETKIYLFLFLSAYHLFVVELLLSLKEVMSQ